VQFTLGDGIIWERHAELIRAGRAGWIAYINGYRGDGVTQPSSIIRQSSSVGGGRSVVNSPNKFIDRNFISYSVENTSSENTSWMRPDLIGPSRMW